MSGAFVREVEGQPWKPPSAPGRYRVTRLGEMVRDGDDLAEVLGWVLSHPHAGYELRDEHGRLLGRI